MKYECIKDGMAKNGRSFTCGKIVELEQDYAEHLVGKGVLRLVNFEKQRPKKNRATAKPNDLEQATE